MGPRGLTVIGVTDESEAKVQPYLEKNGVDYLIALGGAEGYRTKGIPHAWLVDASGTVVWEGHPASLKSEQIEGYLKDVRLTPSFDDLPEGLAKAAKSLNKGDFGKGWSALEKKLEDPGVGSEAQAAIDEIKAYGQRKLDLVDRYADGGSYTAGMDLLAALSKKWRGTEIGDAAKAKSKEWKRDKTIKAELAGEKILAKAEALARAKNPAAAAKLARSVANGSKYAGTTCQARAQKMLDKLGM